MQPDIIALQETHLNPCDKLKIPNYTPYRTDRTTHRGGGTALLVKNSIDHHPTPIASTSFENTTVILDLPNNNNISITSIYRPPHGRINTQELDRLFSQSAKAIVVGDFNAKHAAWSMGSSNTNGSIIHDHIANNNLVLLAPLEPTHFPYHHPSSSTLDFGILKNISSGDATSINDLSSDHNPVAFEINVNASLASPAKKVNITNWTIFCETIHNRVPGNPKMNNIADVDDCIRQFTCNITTAVNLATKSRVIAGPFRQLPSFIVDKIKLKNRFRKFYQQTFYPPYKRKAYKLQREIHEDIVNFDNNRWREMIQGINPEDNSLYEMNRKLSKKCIPTPPILDTDGMKYTPLGKANAFRHCLENSFQVNPEPYCNSHIKKVNRSISNYFHNIHNTSQPEMVSPQEVISLIKKLNPRKATGPDGVSNKALRMLTLNAVTHLTKIFNKCLALHHFPDSWKLAHVLMFPKPNQNHKLPGSYRPISLLSNIGKLFEKVLLKRLNDHCLKNSIIPAEQFGFRSGHSCTHQLLRVTNKIVDGFNAKMYTGGVFLDVRKAFDRMWHNGLIAKFIDFKFPDYLTIIIQKFLSNRKFQVRINQALSSVGNIHAGTPQGSALSPTLYNIFTADFPTNN
ncbi:putative RNA-directed DNA polymerase from transposon X-element, partial [Araneus ventricosus]